jgi:hypothetical protein
MFTVNIAKDFSKVPAGRTDDDGDFNGTKFRRKHLVPALKANEFVQVILDHTEGFGSSFLDEAFGGLVKEEGFSREEIQRRLSFVASTKRAQLYKRKSESYIASAVPKGS